MNGLRKGGKISFVSEEIVCLAQRVQELLFMGVEDRQVFKGIGHISQSGTMYFQRPSKGMTATQFLFQDCGSSLGYIN